MLDLCPSPSIPPSLRCPYPSPSSTCLLCPRFRSPALPRIVASFTSLATHIHNRHYPASTPAMVHLAAIPPADGEPPKATDAASAGVGADPDAAAKLIE